MAAFEVPEGSVVITPQKMYDELLATGQEVRRLASLLDPALKDLRADNADHESRIRALERWRWQSVGAAAVLSSVGVTILSRLIGG